MTARRVEAETAAMIFRVLIADTMSPIYLSPAKFMQSLVDAINIEWRRHGVPGAVLVDATYKDGVAFIETAPGRVPLTLADVRKACGAGM
jgi:hypothetical protein